jgi:acyl-coenzyme A thioesterase PaaI-like protein
VSAPDFRDTTSDRGREVGRYVRVEMREQDNLRMIGRTLAHEHLRRDAGGVRTGALLTMLDNVGGICAGIASLPDGWVVSTNLAARILALDHVGPFRIESDVLRRGRNNVVTSVRIVDEGSHDALVADGVLTSAILVPENGPPRLPASDRPRRARR